MLSPEFGERVMPNHAMRSLALWLSAAILAGLPSCKDQEAKRPAAPSTRIDLRNWKPDPNLPKPEVSAKVEIVKEPERKKISMKVTATESHGLTVHEVHFNLRYRVFDKEKNEYVYPENKLVPKMIPKIRKGHAVFQTPIVETFLQPEAWAGEDDNWDVVITHIGGPYYEEE